LSPFQAFMTALAASIGTGNIAGVATAIVSGGPGALFWIWAYGFIADGDQVRGGVLGMSFPRGAPRRQFGRADVLTTFETACARRRLACGLLPGCRFAGASHDAVHAAELDGGGPRKPVSACPRGSPA